MKLTQLNQTNLASLALLMGLAVLSAPAKAQSLGQINAPQNHWATTSITELTKRGILQGSAPKSMGEKPARKPSKSDKSLDGDAPVTRYEMVVTLWRFVQYLEAADKQKKGKLSVQVSPKEAAKMLVAGGYLPKNSPLVTGDAPKVTTKQFTEAMSLVITHVQEKKTPVSPDSLRAN
jgi:hypothetical protein